MYLRILFSLTFLYWSYLLTWCYVATVVGYGERIYLVIRSSTYSCSPSFTFFTLVFYLIWDKKTKAEPHLPEICKSGKEWCSLSLSMAYEGCVVLLKCLHTHYNFLIISFTLNFKGNFSSLGCCSKKVLRVWNIDIACLELVGSGGFQNLSSLNLILVL